MTQLNLRPRKPDLTVMRQPKILLQWPLQWTVWCVQPSIDLTNDAMALSSKVPVVEVEKGMARELDKLVNHFCNLMKITELRQGHRAYDTVWVGCTAWRQSPLKTVCSTLQCGTTNAMPCFVGTPETFFMICLISRAASETCWRDFETGHLRNVQARSDK